MFKKRTIIIGLILLLAIGVLTSLGWAGVKRAEKRKREPQQIDTQKELQKLPETTTTTEATTTPEKEVIEKYLESYVMKEILFIPWGSGKGEAALREVEFLAQDVDFVTDRYGPSLEVDKEGNIYLMNPRWGKLESWMKEKKRIDNPYVHKYGKIKVKKGNTYEEEYKYLASFSLDEVKKKPLLIEKFSSDYQYEFNAQKEEGKLGLKIIDVKTGRIVGSINFLQGLSRETFLTYPLLTYPHDLLGDDVWKNIYVLFDNTMAGAGPRYEHGWLLKVYKYNKEGQLLAIIELAKEIEYLNRYGGQKNRIRVDKEGNIYQLLGKKDGVHILKWEVRDEK